MTPAALSTRSLIKAQANVIHALILRDIRTRMFNSALGYIAVIGWPLFHILFLVIVYTHTGRIAPFGESMALWCATGIVPFMSFSYMSRFMTMGVILNRPLLHFPAIAVTDILFARAIIEVLSASLVIILVILYLYLEGVDFMPIDITQAAFAILSAMLIGLGFGMVNGVIGAFAPAWVTGYTLIIILLWLTSGVLFVPDTLPQEVQNVLFYHPVLHSIEWMRTAYYDGYHSSLLAKWYPLTVGTVALFLGLLGERVFRGKILS